MHRYIADFDVLDGRNNEHSGANSLAWIVLAKEYE